MHQKIRRVYQPHRSYDRNYVKKHGRRTENEHDVNEDWSESDDFVPNNEDEHVEDFSDANNDDVEESEAESIQEDNHNFPQDPEQFSNKQDFIINLITKLNEALNGNEHVLQIEIERNDVVDAKDLLEEYQDLRDYNQTLAIDSMGDDEEQPSDDDLNNEHDVESHEEAEDNEEAELFSEKEEEEHEQEDLIPEEQGLRIEDEALHVAKGEEHLAGDGKSGEENWEVLDNHMQDSEHQHGTEEHIAHEHNEGHSEELHTTEEENSEEITIDKLPDLLLVVEGLLKTFNQIFTDFPKEPQTHNPEKVEEELENTYKKINQFITSIYSKKDSIESEMKFLIDNIDIIKFTKLDILNFYHYKHLYEELESEVLDDDDNWKQKNNVLDIEINEFIFHVKEIQKNLNDTESAQLMIWNETSFIKDQIESEHAFSINDRIAGLPSLIQKLLNIKFDIDLYLNQISLKIKLLRNQKKQFKETMVDMRTYVGVDGINLRRSKSSNTLLYSSMIILIITFFKFD